MPGAGPKAHWSTSVTKSPLRPSATSPKRTGPNRHQIGRLRPQSVCPAIGATGSFRSGRVTFAATNSRPRDLVTGAEGVSARNAEHSSLFMSWGRAFYPDPHRLRAKASGTAGSASLEADRPSEFDDGREKQDQSEHNQKNNPQPLARLLFLLPPPFYRFPIKATIAIWATLGSGASRPPRLTIRALNIYWSHRTPPQPTFESAGKIVLAFASLPLMPEHTGGTG